MINEVRAYFKARIKDVNSDLTEHDNPFDEQIPETIISDTYIMNIGTISSKFINQTVEDNMPVEIKIFRSGENQLLDNYYTFYQEAHLIRTCSIDPKLSRNGIYIKNVKCNTLDGSKHEGSDNVIVYTLQFEVMLSFELNYS